MKHKLRCLGAVFVAVLVMTGILVPAALAEFHAEIDHTLITAAPESGADEIFTVKAGTVKCGEAALHGTTEFKTRSYVTFTPTFSECTAFGFVNSPVDVNDCHYTYTTTEKEQLHIVCPAGKAITVTAFNCHIKFGNGTYGGIGYTNKGEGTTREITVDINVSGTQYTQESKSFPGCTTGTFTDGKWTGTTTWTGRTTEGPHVGIWKT